MEKAVGAAMHVRGTSKILSVIGCPVEHTMSPYIHEIFIKACQDDMVYVPFRVEAGEVEEAIKGAHALNIMGMNVTIPHKQTVMKELVKIDDGAKLIGAVNTLKWTPEGYEGYNTDMYGFSRMCELEEVPVKDSKVLILGAGGASRSVFASCVFFGASEICVYNIEPYTYMAVDLINEMKERLKTMGREIPKMRLVMRDELETEEFPIVFNATSAGMTPHEDTIAVESEEFYKHIKYALDVVYTPENTRFVNTVRANGGRARSGLSMLFYQGMKSYEIWTGRTFTEEEALKMHDEFLQTAHGVLGL